MGNQSRDYQANSHFCFVCGLKNPAGLHVRFINDGYHQVRVETQICDLHQGYPGIAHGGILATILDEAMGRAGISGATDDRFFYTAKMEIRYRQHVPLNTDLIIKGRILKDRGRAATASGEIILPDGNIAVEGSATLFSIVASEVAKMLGGEQDPGWRVYSDKEYAEMLRLLEDKA